MTSGSNNFSDFPLGQLLLLYVLAICDIFHSSRGHGPSGPMVNTPMKYGFV